MNGLYPGPATEPGEKLFEREPGRSGHCGARRAEVRCSLEIDDGCPERVLERRRIVLRHGLHAGGTPDADVGELRCEVHAEVGGQSGVGGVHEDVPDGFRLWSPRVCDPLVDGKSRRLVAEVDIDGAPQREVTTGEETAQLTEAGSRTVSTVLVTGQGGGCRPKCELGHQDGDCGSYGHRSGQKPARAEQG